MDAGQQPIQVNQGSRFGSRSRQYLTAMGIDIWQTRIARVAEDLSVNSEASAQHGASLKGAPAHINAGGQQIKTNTGASNSGSRESLMRQVSANVQPTSSETPEPKPVEPQLTSKGSSTEQPVAKLEFLLYFINYEAFTIVFAMPYATAELPANNRNLLEGISLFLLGERVSPSIRELRWPIVKASHIDQSEHEARQIIKDSLRQSQGQSQSPSQSQDSASVLVFGEEAWQLLVPNSENTPCQVGDTHQEGNNLFLSLSTMDAISKDAELKRQLWRQLTSFRAVLHG